VTERDLIREVVALADKASGEHAQAAGILYHLAGAITVGPEHLGHTAFVVRQLSRQFMQFVTGEGEILQ